MEAYETLNKSDETLFKSETKNFYFDKTFDRINFFNEEYGYFDRNTKLMDMFIQNLKTY